MMIGTTAKTCTFSAAVVVLMSAIRAQAATVTYVLDNFHDLVVNLTAWESSFGVGAGADADGDGDSDGNDFLAWQQQFTGAAPLAIVAVPEPSSQWIFLFGLVILLFVKECRLQ